jgi:hypothetical protein
MCIIIIIIIIIIHIPLRYNNLAYSLQATSLTDQTLLIHSTAKTFLTVWHVRSITPAVLECINQGEDLTDFKPLFPSFQICILPFSSPIRGNIFVKNYINHRQHLL